MKKLASQVESSCVQQLKSLCWKAMHVEAWIYRVDEVLIEAQAEQRIAEQRRKALTNRTHSQWLESALRKKEQHLQTDGQPRRLLLRSPWTINTAPRHKKACRRAETNWVTDGTGIWRSATPCYATCTHRPTHLDDRSSVAYSLKHERKPSWRSRWLEPQ